MNTLDCIILVITLALVVSYGIWRSRKAHSTTENYLSGSHDLRWWTIGLSIMATQASAVTSLSTPGQGFTDGMQFAQFYFGVPIAMVFLAFLVLPIYYKMRVTTAYEYLEERFDLRMRTVGAVIFLLQRGFSAAITIYAPSLIFSTVFGWSLPATNAFMAAFVVIYTTTGGSAAVSRTQELQMSVILGGLILALFYIFHLLPHNITPGNAWQIASEAGKTQIIDWHFNPHDRYNIWSGVFGATFLFLSYFGADQSQVGRYLSGKTLKESRFGLLFNGAIKIPMQMLVLSVGVLVWVFYQFNAPPLQFNQANIAQLAGTPQEAIFRKLERQNDSIALEKQAFLQAKYGDNKSASAAYANEPTLQTLEKRRIALRKEAEQVFNEAGIKSKDKDYIFLNFVFGHLPHGIIGIILAMIFCAAWGATSSELSALAATSVSDIYRRSLAPGRSDAHYLRAAHVATVLWGIFIMAFASFITLPENLIQMVNMVGSLFYGILLGIFFTAFFLKKVGGKAVFWAAVVAQMAVLYLFFYVDRDAFLWYNPIGCGLVMGLATILQIVLPKKG